MSSKTIAIGIGAFVVGATGGFILGRQLTIKKLETWANDEISKVRAQYREREAEILEAYNNEPDDPQRKTGVFSTPEGAAKILIGAEALDPDQQALQEFGRDKVNELMVKNGYAPLSGFEQPTQNDVTETAESLAQVGEAPEFTVDGENPPNPLEGLTGEMIEKSIWENTAATGEIAVVTDAPEDEEQEDEGDENAQFIPRRHPDRPYVIPESFYDSDEGDFKKVNLVYFEEDGVLMAEDETLVPDQEGTVGKENLHRFGVGSNDRNTVYIRNEKRKADFEVIRDKRSYTEVVHGVVPQRESSAPRKMRDDGE